MLALKSILYSPLFILAHGLGTPDPEGTANLCREVANVPRNYQVEVFVPEPILEEGVTLKRLNRDVAKRQTAWLRKNGLDDLWTHEDLQTQGIHTTGWEPDVEITISAKNVDMFGVYWCPMIKDVRIHILVQSKITIPTEFPEGSCEFDNIYAHEYKHHLVNKYVVEQTFAKLRADLPQIVADMESQGYVGRDQIEYRVSTMKAALHDMFTVYLKEEMQREMADLQGQVDTPEEYARVGKLQHICMLKAKQRVKRRLQKGAE